MFGMSKLMMGGGGSEPFDLDFFYWGRIASSGNKTTYTFASQNFGPPHLHRMIVVGIACGASSDSISSVTIGGISATVVTNGAGYYGASAIAYAKVSTGTELDVVVTLSDQGLDCRIFKYSFKTFTTTALDSGTAYNVISGTDLSVADIECQNGGVVIACAFGAATGGMTSSWNGTDSAVEDNDASYLGNNLWAGHVLTTEDSTVRDYTITSQYGGGMSAVASFGFSE